MANFSIFTASSSSTLHFQTPKVINSFHCRPKGHRPSNQCSFNESSSPENTIHLEVGTPIVVIDTPKTIKTAASMPCLILNKGIVKPGDVGRIVSRKPKDVWAVRLAIGTYLLDGKYFKPLDSVE